MRPGNNGFVACDSRWWDVIDHCEAAGVVVLWSAGNEGPAPYTLRTPPDRATSPTSSFSIGSTRTTLPYQISGFSSRGPSRCGGPWEIKPEVVAPGQDIFSAYPGGQFAYMSGTSMAGPHVAGVVALIRQARPDLDVETVKEILIATSRDLGLPGEDNDYGHGIVDAYAAVLMALNEIGTVSGEIRDATDGQPLAGVTVRDLDGLTARTTGADGLYAFSLRAGPRRFSAGKFGYVPHLETVQITAGETLLNDVPLERPSRRCSPTRPATTSSSCRPARAWPTTCGPWPRTWLSTCATWGWNGMRSSTSACPSCSATASSPAASAPSPTPTAAPRPGSATPARRPKAP
jgi:hypothetical protein